MILVPSRQHIPGTEIVSADQWVLRRPRYTGAGAVLTQNTRVVIVKLLFDVHVNISLGKTGGEPRKREEIGNWFAKIMHTLRQTLDFHR